MDCACFGEVERLHRFFQDWYRGEENASFERLEDALDPAFAIVTPKGKEFPASGTLDSIREGRGNAPELTIRIVTRSCRRLRGLHLTTYEEHQEEPDETTARLSTALLEHRGDAWLWHHVHETWLET